MGSYIYGKPETCAWIREHFTPNSTVLDVGACEGLWRNLLHEYPLMDAVEAFEPNARTLRGYNRVFCEDIRNFKYDWYDLIIFGDVLEHLSVGDAQAVLEYAKPRCRDMVIAVPFEYEQGAIYGNPYEVHVQDDLTPELFDERYPGYEVICRPLPDYCYYHKGGAA